MMVLRVRWHQLLIITLFVGIIGIFCKMILLIHSRRRNLLCIKGDVNYGVTISGILKSANQEANYELPHLDLHDSEEKPFTIADHRIFPPGLRLTPYYDKKYTIDVNGTSENQSKQMYHNYLSAYQVECRHRAHLGGMVSGGWDVCLVGPYKLTQDSLIYSFSIDEDDRSFAEATAEEFGCTVRSFDPSLKEPKRHKNVLHYPHGLGGNDGITKKTYRLNTLDSLMEMVGDHNRTIDYLQMDINKLEWSVLANLLEDGTILPKIKQLAIQLYIRRTDTMEDFAEYLNILTELETFGFRRWYINSNNLRFYVSKISEKLRTLTHEIVLINTNYLHPS